MFSLQRQTSERVSKSDAFNAKVSHPSRTVVHPKLEMTEPGDHDEQEADAVANDVMSGKICRQISHGSVGGGMSVSPQMEGRLSSLQGGGQAMPDGLRSMMERGFSRDFSQVRLHTDSEAASLSSSIHAKAFTHGNDIYFNQGQFSPNTSEGQKLMAHELTHVVQRTEKVGRQEENAAAEEEKVALIFHANPWITGYDDNGKIVTNKDHGIDEYSGSAEAAAKAIKEQKNPDENLFHLPNVKPSKVLMFETFTKFDFFEKIRIQKDDSISFLSLYSHGQSDQIVLGYLSEIDGEYIDIDIHFNDIIENAPLLRKKFSNNATIELWGCNLGSGALPIAQVLANAIGKGVNVYAWNSSTQKKQKNGENITDGTFIASKYNRSRLKFSEKSMGDLLKYSPLYDRKSAKKKQKLPDKDGYLDLLRLLDGMSKGEELENLGFYQKNYEEIYESLLEYERENLYRYK